MAEVSVSKLMRIMLDNPELFRAIQEAGTVEDLSATLATGQQTEILTRKAQPDTPEETISEGREILVSLAAWVAENVKPSGTSGDQRLSVPTAEGKFTVVLQSAE